MRMNKPPYDAPPGNNRPDDLLPEPLPEVEEAHPGKHEIPEIDPEDQHPLRGK